MIKRGPVAEIVAGTVHPGRYLVLVIGEGGAVEEAVAAGGGGGGGGVPDRGVLPSRRPPPPPPRRPTPPSRAPPWIWSRFISPTVSGERDTRCSRGRCRTSRRPAPSGWPGSPPRRPSDPRSSPGSPGGR